MFVVDFDARHNLVLLLLPCAFRSQVARLQSVIEQLCNLLFRSGQTDSEAEHRCGLIEAGEDTRFEILSRALLQPFELVPAVKSVEPKAVFMAIDQHGVVGSSCDACNQ